MVEYRTAKLHLVDLAGSERVKRSGAAGARLRETVNINQVRGGRGGRGKPAGGGMHAATGRGGGGVGGGGQVPGICWRRALLAMVEGASRGALSSSQP
jgi:hypothetical protein